MLLVPEIDGRHRDRDRPFDGEVAGDKVGQLRKRR
jgi:hypothetical protein